jgi:excisionase family DNA binding protein
MVMRGVCCVVKLVTTKDAAKKLGVTDGCVRAMILGGRLPAGKFGRAHLIREEDLKLVKNRKPGRESYRNWWKLRN